MKDINLVPKPLLKQTLIKKNTKKIITIGGLISFLIVCGAVWPVIELGITKYQNKNLEKQVADLTNVGEQKNLLNKLSVDLRKKEKLAEQLEKKQDVTVNLLSKIEKVIPQGVKSYNVDFSSKESTITISCLAYDTRTVADFIYNIQRSDCFKEQFVPNIGPQIGTTPNRNFSITFKYEEKEQDTNGNKAK